MPVKLIRPPLNLKTNPTETKIAGVPTGLSCENSTASPPKLPYTVPHHLFPGSHIISQSSFRTWSGVESGAEFFQVFLKSLRMF